MNLFATTTRIAFTAFGKPEQRGSKICVGANGGGTMLIANGGELPTLERYGKAWVVRGARPIIKDENTDRSKKWMAQVKRVAGCQIWDAKPIAGPVRLTARFYFERPACHYGTGRNAHKLKDSAPEHHVKFPDLDKLVRALADAMSGVMYVDDKQIVEHVSGRYWCAGGELERCEVLVEELE